MTTNIYQFLTPIALIFILLEISLCWIYKRKYISFQESVANFGTALGNQTINVLVAVAVYEIYGYLWENYRFFTIDMNPLSFFALLLSIDFIFYWVHRWGHEYNIMWAAHSPHHSAEEMNFLVALRASVTQRLFSFFFFWPLTIIGFKPIDIYTMTGIHLFIAFLHHTEFIPKLGRWIEFVFTTPSHHRVHHGINFKYLDKNFGEFLIIWDRLFGSFEEEKEKVIYGMYHAPKTWNPIVINFHYYQVLWKDAVETKNLWDKIRIWFMPLGWRPLDLPPRPQLVEITEQNQKRYSSTMFQGAKPYLIVQIIIGIVLMLLVISPNSPWNIFERWVGGVMLWHLVINWSGILESKRWLFTSELIRIFIFGIVIINFNQWIQLPYVVMVVVASTLMMAWCWRYFRGQGKTALV
jgi:alkylglycerol monooxygenase